MKKQTAVSWLVNQLKVKQMSDWNKIIIQAHELQRQQMWDMWMKGKNFTEDDQIEFNDYIKDNYK